MVAKADVGDTDATPPQGTLQFGTEQVPEERGTHRPRAQSTKTIEPSLRREPRTASDPPQTRESIQSSEPFLGSEPNHPSDPTGPREPRQLSKRRAINIPHDPSESQLHQSIAELLDWILKEPAFYTTFPAGWGKLTKGTAGRLFASGLKKGMPDILVFDRDRVVGIELKAGKNSVTSAQRTMHARLQAVGIRVYVCRTQEDVLAALDCEHVDRRALRYQNAGTHAEVAT